MHASVELHRTVSILQGYTELAERTMTVLPLYWRMWQDRPTSLPPPRHRNISSSAGSMGSTSSGSKAACFLLDAIFKYLARRGSLVGGAARALAATVRDAA